MCRCPAEQLTFHGCIYQRCGEQAWQHLSKGQGREPALPACRLLSLERFGFPEDCRRLGLVIRLLGDRTLALTARRQEMRRQPPPPSGSAATLIIFDSQPLTLTYSA